MDDCFLNVLTNFESVLPFYIPWNQREQERSISLKWIKKQKTFQNVFHNSNRHTWYMEIHGKCRKKMISKTNAICNELYYVQNLRKITWSRNLDTTKMWQSRYCHKAVIVRKRFILIVVEFLHSLLRALEL